MKKAIWTEEYRVSSYLVNLRGQAGLHTLLNFIQDVGWMHAHHLEIKLPKHLGWVFTRQKLVMSEWPQWNESVTIKTWIRPPANDFFSLRDYEIFVNEKKIGECTSTFTVLDLQERKLAIIDWSQFGNIGRQDYQHNLEPKKIIVNSDLKDLAEFQVRNSDIDLNRHVNNTKYAQWILDALPLEILRGGVELKEYEVNFLAEAKSDDVITVQQTKVDKQEGDFTVTQFQGIRKSDGKNVFTAQMKIQICSDRS